MKKQWLIAAGLATALSAQAQDLNKVGVINVMRMQNESPSLQQKAAALRSQFEPRQKQLEQMGQQLQQMGQQLEKEKTTSTPSQTKAKEEQLAERLREFQKNQAALQQEFMTKRNEAVSAWQEKVYGAVAQVAKQKGLDAVFVAEAFAWFRPNMDVTDDVLRQMGEGGGKK